jgi:hypothetical protein
MGVIIKAVFGLLAALFYGFGSWSMLIGAMKVPGYHANEAVTYLVTAAGASITAYVTTQLGIVIASPTKDDDGGSVKDRLDNYSDGGNNWVTIGVLLVDTAVLVAAGLAFVWVWARPDSIAVASANGAAVEAPDYITLQAKAFVALVLAGAAGVGVAAKK